MPFNEERKPINLGGASSTISLRQVLDEVRRQRLTGENARKRDQAATKLQTWWRKIRAQKSTRTQCRLLFDADPSTLVALRSLVLLQDDVCRMHLWSSTMVKGNGILLLKRLASYERSSWLILIRQISIRWLKFMANSPSSPLVWTHLELMNIWLNPTNSNGAGSCNSERSSAIVYMLRNGYYQSLCKVITSVRRSFASLLLLIHLVTFPLHLLHGLSDRNPYTTALLHFALYVLPLPQFTSRLIKLKFAVEVGVFLEDLVSLMPLFPQIESQVTLQFSIHSLSNLMLFTPPRYSQLSVPSYEAYLRLLTILLNVVPEVILEGSNVKEREDSWTDFCSKKYDVDLPTNIDPKTRARLASILSPDHLCKLLKAADCPRKLLSIATYLPGLCLSWPSQVRNALDAVATFDATAFARLLYVEKVADMPLGKTFVKNPVKLIGSFTFENWARLLFFTDLFILLNQQMNDREFCGTTVESQSESNLRNPLDINQLQTFLKQLCTIVYDLDRVPAIGVNAPVTKGMIDWTRLTARLKDYLVVLYCRDLRRPRQPSEISESEQETIQDDSEADDALSSGMSKEEVAALLESAKSPRERLLESDPICFHEILAQQDLEDNISEFRYFSWPERMPREVVFPHRLGDFYLMRFERSEAEFNRTELPDPPHRRQWPFFGDTCNQIIQCYEAALDLAPPMYPAIVDLNQKLAFMYLWRFEMHWQRELLDDCRRAAVYLQNALELDGSFPCLKRTIEIGWWFFHSFAQIVGMMKEGYLNTSHPNRFSQTAFLTFCFDGPELEKLAQDVAMFGDHPAISHAILAIKQNVETMAPDSLEPLASWYFQRYRGREQAEDLDDAIALQTNAFMQIIKARDKERFDEQREVGDESERERDKDEALQQVENGTALRIEADVNADPPKPKPKPRKKTSDMDVVNCGHQLALWLKIRYEVHHSNEDLENLRKLLHKLVMSYASHGASMGGIFECAFIFSRLPPPSKIPYALYDQAILALHSCVISSLQIGAPDLFLRTHDSPVFIGDIVAMALRDNNLIKAIEWLENSRCLIWSYLSSLEEAPISMRLTLGQRDLGPSLFTTIFHAREAIRHGLLKYSYLDGNQVVRHLTDGPIILLNASVVGCDALVLRPNAAPQRLPLAILSFDQVSGWEKDFMGLLSSVTAPLRGEERKGRLSKCTPGEGDDKFQSLLGDIWVSLVVPILNFVWGGKDSKAMSENRTLPRIWWCCTGPFSTLPIHAAGLYTSFGPQVRLSDFAVSSYVTSLSSVISSIPTDPPPDFKLLVIAQPSTPDLPRLPGATKEVFNIRKQANSLPTVILNSEEATIAAVMGEAASAPWVHAACHGRQGGIWSSFALHDGSLELQQLATSPRLCQAEFAFLSACETATGDRHLSGEALHLAGSLHRLGYRSVIATLFSVRDQDAPFVTDKVYEQLFKDKRPDYRKAAQALHQAIHFLQEANGRGNFIAWIPFIHIGM